MVTFRHPWITDWLTWVRVDGLFQFLFSQAVQNWHERQHKKKREKKKLATLFFCHVFSPLLPCLFCICLRYWNLRPIVFYGGYTFWICRLPSWFGRHSLLFSSFLIINGPNSLQYLTGSVKERAKFSRFCQFLVGVWTSYWNMKQERIRSTI